MPAIVVTACSFDRGKMIGSVAGAVDRYGTPLVRVRRIHVGLKLFDRDEGEEQGCFFGTKKL